MTIMTAFRAVHAQHESDLLALALQLGVALLAREPRLRCYFKVEGDVRACAERPLTKLPRLSLATRRRSDSLVDGVTVMESHIDAIDAKFKLRNSRKQTLSQYNF